MSPLILAILVAILPPCATEDSATCYWDANTNGNGQGSSFIDIAGEVFYLDEVAR